MDSLFVYHGMYFTPSFAAIGLGCMGLGGYRIWQPRLRQRDVQRYRLDPDTDRDEVGDGERVIGRILGIALVCMGFVFFFLGALLPFVAPI